jgi:hypothetical protein
MVQSDLGTTLLNRVLYGETFSRLTRTGAAFCLLGPLLSGSI